MPDPLDPQRSPPLDRFCDLVLKGGVVDGVIYPGVLIELAREFRFQSLAGTSVGAIAAALAAASEFSRRFGSDIGFNEVLRKVPDELAQPDPQKESQTVLQSLFQTTPPLQRLFAAVVDLMSVARDKFLRAFVTAVWVHYKWVLLGWFLAGIAVFFIFALGGSLWMSYLRLVGTAYTSALVGVENFLTNVAFSHIPVALMAGLLTAVLGFGLTVYREYLCLTGQPGFGFCSGLSTDGGTTEALVEWLHRGIQGAARMELSRPLTFQDLWDAPCGPKNVDGTPLEKSIDLRMMTTCVSHGRPYEMPMVDTSVRLFFSLKEWSHYFPPSIIEHLREVSARYSKESISFLAGGDIDGVRQPDVQSSPHVEWIPCGPDCKTCNDRVCCEDCQDDFRELPVGQLPVLVAVRLSMNVPVLFQAVPLWAIDHEGGRTKTVGGIKAAEFKKAWFADGGLTSNFPLHIFDSPIPEWPTFGVYIAEESRNKTLDKKPHAEKRPYFLTEFHTSGRGEKWFDISDVNTVSASKPMNPKGFVDYLFGVGYAAKDWADNANLRMPGTRDRVVVIYTEKLTLGGFYLKLPRENILGLSYGNGTKAGKELAKKFLPTEPKFNPKLEGSAAWLDHRWVRFNAYLTAVKSHLRGLSVSANSAHGTSSLREQIEQAKNKAPLYYVSCFEPKLTDLQATSLNNALDALQDLEAALTADTVTQPYVARPQYELKARSRT
ncbi:MAG: patatin-like phospholipase family protein [Pseudomonadota bacterium]